MYCSATRMPPIQARTPTQQRDTWLLLPYCCSEVGKEGPPFTAYWKPAITNCVGPACGLQALKYISYPAQVSSGLLWRSSSSQSEALQLLSECAQLQMLLQRPLLPGLCAEVALATPVLAHSSLRPRCWPSPPK